MCNMLLHMKQTTVAITKLKRLFARVPEEIHAAAKIAAIEAGQNLEDWAGETIAKRLRKEKRLRPKTELSIIRREE